MFTTLVPATVLSASVRSLLWYKGHVASNIQMYPHIIIPAPPEAGATLGRRGSPGQCGQAKANRENVKNCDARCGASSAIAVLIESLRASLPDTIPESDTTQSEVMVQGTVPVSVGQVYDLVIEILKEYPKCLKRIRELENELSTRHDPDQPAKMNAEQ